MNFLETKMTRLVLLMASVALVVFTGATSNAFAQSKATDTFSSFTKLAMGGTWTATVGDAKLEHSYSWAAGEKFAQLKTKGGISPSVAIFGVDLEADSCNWWFFSDDGGHSKLLLTQESDGVWILQGQGMGVDGKTKYKSRVTRIDDDTINEDIVELVGNGVKQPNTTITWKRQRRDK